MQETKPRAWEDSSVDADDEDYNESRRCMCMSLDQGMVFSGIVALGFGIGHYFLLHYMTNQTHHPIELIVGCLFSGSSAYILWTMSILTATVTFSSFVTRHPLGRRQFAYLNFYVLALFSLAVIYNGLKAPSAAKVEIMDRFLIMLQQRGAATEFNQYASKISSYIIFMAIGFVLNHAFNGSIDNIWIVCFISEAFAQILFLFVPMMFFAPVLRYAWLNVEQSEENVTKWRTVRGEREKLI